METAIDPTAWSGLLLGLAALSAGAGALRRPGIWRQMIEEIEHSPTLQFVCGMMELVVGALVYLANPWQPADLLACVMKSLGGLMMAEALTIIMICDIYSQFWLRSLSHMHRGWAGFTAGFGLVLAVLALMRFR